MDERLALLVDGSPNSLAVNVYGLFLLLGKHLLHPLHEFFLKHERGEHCKGSPERIVRGNPVGKLQEASEPGFPGFSEIFYFIPALFPTRNCTECNHYNVY